VIVVPATVNVPVRGLEPKFAATATRTVPSPLPAAPSTIASQDAPVPAIHAHPGAAVTVMVAVSPAAGLAIVVGDAAKEHGTASCVTVTVLPPIVSVAARGLEAVFGATVTLTVPLPEPEAPAVIDSHDALEAAVHAHPAGAVIETVLFPPPAGVEIVVGAIV